jgi:hypothetical protein
LSKNDCVDLHQKRSASNWCLTWDSSHGIPTKAINPENLVSKTNTYADSVSEAVVDGDGFKPPLLLWNPALQAGAFDHSASHPKKRRQKQKSPETLRHPGLST